MLEDPTGDRRARRHEATKAEILDAAWAIVRAEGLAALTLREVAARVGMRAPSLYSYFDSKHAVYDAMFAQGLRECRAAIAAATFADDPTVGLQEYVRGFVDFCAEDPARYQLLFQRTIPGFEPSPASWALAVEVYDEDLRPRLAAVGVTEQRDLDLFTAVLTGLVDQQISNDPGGDRWRRLADDAVDMYLGHVTGRRRAPKRR